MNTSSSTFTLDGIFAVVEHTDGKSYNITYDTKSKWGTLTFDNVTGGYLDTVLSLLKIYDAIIGISAVNDMVGFAVGGISHPFATTITNLMTIIEFCVTKCLFGKADEVMNYEVVKGRLTELMSPAGIKEIEEEKRIAVSKVVKGVRDVKVHLQSSPAAQLVVSFIMVWVNCILTDTPYDKGSLNLMGRDSNIPNRPTHSIVNTKITCSDLSSLTGIWSIGVVTGLNDTPLPKKIFMSDECKKGKGKKRKRRRHGKKHGRRVRGG